MAAPTRPGILKKNSRDKVPIRPKNVKKGRLIIRNLSFKVSDAKLKEIFSKYGNVVDVNIPLKTDGKKRGFAFVQFEKTNDAIRAINGLNSKNILNRPVAVDFAVSKSIYEATTNRSDLEVVDENFKPETRNNLYDDDEEDSPTEMDDNKSSDSGLDSNGDESELEDNNSEDGKESNQSEDEEEEEQDHDSSDDDKEDLNESEKAPRKMRKRDPDAGDGRTLFIRNLSFQSHDEDLEDLMEEFGDVEYALFCQDPSTGLPKGTGFVRFTNKESAQACLDKSSDNLQGGVLLDGRRLNISLALERGEAQKRAKKEEKQGKDNRNLYLSREGLIRQGTQAAEGVSKTDLALRARLEYRKRNALRNLHFFVSRTRLCVHNLPPSFDNRMMRQLFLKASDDPTARITEARIMKEQKGFGKSKGFGFVEFTNHEAALAALRKLNNNPNIFTVQKRPIVEFSVENRNALNTKLKRQEKAMAQQEEGNAIKKGKLQKKRISSLEVPAESSSFTGFKSKKDVKNLPSHFGPKIRHKKPKVDLKMNKEAPRKGSSNDNNKGSTKETKKQKTRRKSNKGKKDFREEKEFQTLVNKYKGGLSSVSEAQRRKWYEAD